MIIIVPVVGKDYGIIITVLTIFGVLAFSYLVIKIIRKKCIKSIKRSSHRQMMKNNNFKILNVNIYVFTFL